MDAEVWITGNIGSEVNVREFSDGGVAATFRLACTPRLWRNGEWGDDRTTWLQVACSRALAQNVKSSLGKGDPVIVVGRLRTDRWTDDQGVAHERIKLQAQAVGHDLSRGTAVFRRSARPAADEDNEVTVTELVADPAEEEPGDDGVTSAA
ncbi:MAG: single-stranded DNA-binding protein [Propionicimonas sp.]|uniref:single-stranded DNA-binding protein n=1 Tax=Propionicimonas sp. TaxID=1955623 RepID=UPI003D1175BD